MARSIRLSRLYRLACIGMVSHGFLGLPMSPAGSRLASPLDGGPTYPLGDRAYRALWATTWLLLASWTPRMLYKWRRFLLRLFGARMGRNTDVLGSARVWTPRKLIMGDHALIAQRARCYNLAEIRIENGALVSQDAYLCAGTHDVDDPRFPLIARPITIGASAWIAASAFVGPGVTVGEGAVLGAGAVAFRDLAPWTINVGNPARPVRERDRRAAVARPSLGSTEPKQ